MFKGGFIKNIATFFILFLVSLNNALAYVPDNLVPENISRVKDSVYLMIASHERRIDAKTKELAIRRGTGFVIKDNIMVTNFHVLAGILDYAKDDNGNVNLDLIRVANIFGQTLSMR